MTPFDYALLSNDDLQWRLYVARIWKDYRTIILVGKELDRRERRAA